MIEWLAALALTQVVEVPIWLRAGRSTISSLGKNFLCAFGASAMTHPVLWFAFPWHWGNYWAVLIAAESFAVVTESFWAKWWGLPYPWRVSLLANACSWVIGFLLQAIFQLKF